MLKKRHFINHLARNFPEYYQDGKFASTRLSFVEFIDKALPALKPLGIHKSLESYKELMRVFPPGRFVPDKWNIGIKWAPQQAAAIRILFEMERNNVKADKEMTRIIEAAFGNSSEPWKKICRHNYWQMKGRHIDKNPLPENLPDEVHQVAKIVLDRMVDDLKMKTVIRHTSELPDSVDQTWVAYSHSASQSSIINKLDDSTMLFIENSGLVYARETSLTYFTLKVKVSDEIAKQKLARPSLSLVTDFNNLKMGFFGKPLKDKLQELEDRYFVDDGYVLAMGITGTSSQDSVLSILKFLQQVNPRLKKLNVVFRMSRQVPELLDPFADPELDERKQSKFN